jgi:hypothetical protein
VEKMNESLSKEELIDLVDKICNPKLSDEKVSEYIEVLEDNVPHPAPSDLIFWSEEDLSPERVVEIALAYKEEK